MRLPHLLIPILVAGFGVPFAAWLMQLMGFHFEHGKAPWFLFVIVIISGLPLYWWIIKLLGFTPLMIFAPSCPHCYARPHGWWGVDRQMPKRGRMPEKVVLACGLCGGRVDLWLRRRVPPGATPSAGPSYCLRWPEFLGIWRRLKQ